MDEPLKTMHNLDVPECTNTSCLKSLPEGVHHTDVLFFSMKKCKSYPFAVDSHSPTTTPINQNALSLSNLNSLCNAKVPSRVGEALQNLQLGDFIHTSLNH